MLTNDDILNVKEGLARYKARGADTSEFEILNMVDDCKFQWPVAVWLLNKIINMPANTDFAILGKSQKEAWDWCSDDLVRCLHSLGIYCRFHVSSKSIILADNRRIIFCSTGRIGNLFGLNLASAASLQRRGEETQAIRNKLQPFTLCGKIATGGKNEN